MNMIQHHIKLAIRNLLKYKAQSLISIIGLAVGVCCFAICSYTLRVDLNWNHNIKEVERICIVFTETEKGSQTSYSPFASAMLAKEFPEIESATAYSQVQPYTEKLCEIRKTDGTTNYFKELFVFADHHFLDFFNIRLINGNPNEINQTPDAILVTEKTANRLFGTTDVIGKTFTDINDFDDTQKVFTIRGVIENFPKQSDLERYSGIELNTTNEAICSPDRYIYYDGFNSFVKIKPGINIDKLNEKLKKSTLKYPKNKNEIAESIVQLKPLTKRDTLYKRNFFSDSGSIFFIIGLLVLLTALFNYVLFIIGRMMNRIKECGIRQVNGATKYSIFYLLFIEASIAFLIACTCSFTIAELVIPHINSLNPDFSIDNSYVVQLLTQYSIIGLGGIALLCLIVIHNLGKISLIQSLFSNQIIRRHSVLRNIFISIQLVICFLFLGTTWFVKQQSDLIEYRLTNGLNETDKTSTFDVSLNGDKLTPHRPEILQKLRQDPKVEIVCRNGMGFSGAWQLREGSFSWEGISDEVAKSTMGHIYTDPSFFELVNQKLRDGRLYSSEETDKEVVNESFARLFNRNPIGMQINVRYWGTEMSNFQVVGIVSDFMNNRQEMNTRPVLPCIYMPFPQNSLNMSCLVKIKPEYRKEFPEIIKAELSKYVNQATPTYIFSMKDDSGFYVSREQNIFKLTTIFSIISIIISLLGIYASVTLSTDRRKKEVAIRKINGATPATIVHMFCKSNLLQLFVSACIAFPILILLLKSWLESYAERISIGILPFILIFLLMAVIVAITIIWQLWKIARINPAEVIKSE